jgi:hypothetical protein
MSNNLAILGGSLTTSPDHPTWRLVYFALLITIIFYVWLLWSEFRVSTARRQGIYPPKSKVTMDAVKELASKGEEILAMRAYRELTGRLF